MNALPLLYLAPHVTQATHAGGLGMDLAGEGLPPAKAWVDALPAEVFARNTLGLLLADTLMHPLRVTLEDKVKRAELGQFLTWKLKRFLPWPSDQTLLRYLPLAEDNTWLTFSLPKPWVDAVTDALTAKGVQLGYISGAFATVLENQSRARGADNLCFFEDCYLYASLDAAGHYLRFSTRRLPFMDNEGGRLDVATLHDQDLAVLLTAREQPLQVYNFAPSLDAEIPALMQRLSRDTAPVRRLRLEGTSLARISACLHDEGVYA